MTYHRIFLYGTGLFHIGEARLRRDLLLFGNAEPNTVYVGTAGIRYERNPNMRGQC